MEALLVPHSHLVGYTCFVLIMDSSLPVVLHTTSLSQADDNTKKSHLAWRESMRNATRR